MKPWQTTAIICSIVFGALIIATGVNYMITYQNFQSIPYYDKWCGLNMTQTWENAGKLWWIDMDPCTSIHVSVNNTITK